MVDRRIRLDLYLESVTSHAASVLLNERLAVEGRVLGVGEQHTLVSFGLFVLAYAAGLSS